MNSEGETSASLTPSEEAEFAKCKEVVQKGLSTFYDVGTALLKIRDNKWYRNTHKTFEAFCRAEWEMSRQRAHQLIDAAVIAENLSTVVDTKPTSEWQIRPLTSVSPEQQREVWEEATRTTKKPTAKEVKAAVEKRSGVTNEQKDEPPPRSSDPHTPAQMEEKLQEQADEGLEQFVWDKIKDRFVPLCISLEPDERGVLISAIEHNIDKIRYDQPLT